MQSWMWSKTKTKTKQMNKETAPFFVCFILRSDLAFIGALVHVSCCGITDLPRRQGSLSDSGWAHWTILATFLFPTGRGKDTYVGQSTGAGDPPLLSERPRGTEEGPEGVLRSERWGHERTHSYSRKQWRRNCSFAKGFTRAQRGGQS